MKKTILLILLLTIFGADPGYCVCNGPNCDEWESNDTVAFFVYIEDPMVWQPKSHVVFALSFTNFLPNEANHINAVNFIFKLPEGAELTTFKGVSDKLVEVIPELADKVSVAVIPRFSGDPSMVKISISMTEHDLYFDAYGYDTRYTLVKFALDCSRLNENKSYNLWFFGKNYHPDNVELSSIGMEGGKKATPNLGYSSSFCIKGDYAAESYEFPIRGDVNDDGYVNVTDVSEIYTCILSGEYNVACDLNGNDVINVEDVSKLYKIILDQ